MDNVKKCKITMENKDGKLITKERGYCDKNNPNKRTDRDTEVDIQGMDKAMESLE